MTSTDEQVRPGEWVRACRLDDLVTVLEGLNAGDRVVVRGNESLRDGRELAPVDDEG